MTTIEIYHVVGADAHCLLFRGLHRPGQEEQADMKFYLTTTDLKRLSEAIGISLKQEGRK